MSEHGSVTFPLPWPPSINDYYGRVPATGIVYIKKPGKVFRERVVSMLAGVHQFGGADLAALIDYYPARGRPDLDNRLKPLLDALEHAGIYDNDRQIDDLRIRRKHNVKGGRVIVQLWRISDVRD